MIRRLKGQRNRNSFAPYTNESSKICPDEKVVYKLLSLVCDVCRHNENYEQFLQLSNVFPWNVLQMSVIKDDVRLTTMLLSLDHVKAIKTELMFNDLCIGSINQNCENIATRFFDKSAIDYDGNSALHAAASKSYSLLKKLLLQCHNSQAFLKKKNSSQETVFYVGIKEKTITNVAEFLSFMSNPTKFIQKELYNCTSVFKSAHVEKFIKLLKSYGADFNYRNKKGYRPVDQAIDLYGAARSVDLSNGNTFTEKEKIMHAFLHYTPHIQDEELVDIFNFKNIPTDVITIIMEYHHVNDANRLVAKRLFSTKSLEPFDYYEFSLMRKQAFKDQSILYADNEVSRYLEGVKVLDRLCVNA